MFGLDDATVGLLSTGLGVGGSLFGSIFGSRSAENRRRDAMNMAMEQQRQALASNDQNRFRAQLYGQDTAGLAEGGRERAEAAIGRTFDRNLAGANQVSQAALGGMGTTSLLSNAIAGNSRQNAIDRSGALASLYGQYLDRQLGARNATQQTLAGYDQTGAGIRNQYGSMLTGLAGSGSTQQGYLGAALQGLGGYALGGGFDSLFGQTRVRRPSRELYRSGGTSGDYGGDTGGDW